jgi:hypothetical protein
MFSSSYLFYFTATAIATEGRGKTDACMFLSWLIQQRCQQLNTASVV